LSAVLKIAMTVIKSLQIVAPTNVKSRSVGMGSLDKAQKSVTMETLLIMTNALTPALLIVAAMVFSLQVSKSVMTAI
jgi:hypothetical protein